MTVNNFKIDDQVVLLTLAVGNAYLWKVVSTDESMIEISQTGYPNEWVHFLEIKHASDDEIATGRRINTHSSQSISDISIQKEEKVNNVEELDGNIAIFDRYSKIIRVVRTTPIATAKDIQIQAMPDLSYRSSQRYLTDLVKAGYIRRFGDVVSGYRYYPTKKIEQMFGVH